MFLLMQPELVQWSLPDCLELGTVFHSSMVVFCESNTVPQGATWFYTQHIDSAEELYKPSERASGFIFCASEIKRGAGMCVGYDAIDIIENPSAHIDTHRGS
jgi:hypothetical protein